MNKHVDPDAQHAAATTLSLADLLAALKWWPGLSATRLRDLRSAVVRVGALLREELSRIPLDLPMISTRLAAINPIAAGISVKRLSNIRSDFLAAVKISGLATTGRAVKVPLSDGWAELMATSALKRVHIGLSRFARVASAAGIEPADVDDSAIECFIAAVREGSLHRKPEALHRTVALIWNELACVPELELKAVTVPIHDNPNQRIDLNLVPVSGRQDIDAHLEWCRGSDPFDTGARERPLAEQSVKLRRSQIHTAVTALIQSGVAPAAITSLAVLVSPDALKRILRRRMEIAGNRPNVFNRDLGAALIHIAREWVKVDAVTLAELKRIVGKMPVPAPGLTSKNKTFLRQFDDPAVLMRLFELPALLWREVKRDDNRGDRRLAKAQAALALAILTYMPIRPQNLIALAFGIHLFLGDNGHGVSSLELPAGEVKNGTPLEFDLPPHVAKMLIDYRDRIAPKIIGHRPTRLFVNADGTAKCQDAVSDLITRTLRQRAGIVLTPHQFRHLTAKLMLDEAPGNFMAVSEILGHKNPKTTVNFYGGIDHRRAGRHHQRLIGRKLAERKLPAPRGRRKKKDEKPGEET
jgi:integrase